MSKSEDGESRHLSSYSANKECTCLSLFTLEPSEADVTSEMNFEDCSQEAQESSQADKIDLSFEDGRTYAKESSKVELDFEDGAAKNLWDETLGEKVLSNEVCFSKSGEIGETGEVNVDLEEGEIQDSSSEKSANAYSCRYYQMGSCVYGKDCRFFHLSEKGLYSMFDLPVSAKTNNTRHPPQYVEQQSIFVPPVFEDEETAWDHSLKEALDRIKSKKKVTLGHENLRMIIQSVDYIDQRRTSKKSLPKNSYKRKVLKARSSSRSRRKTTYKVSVSKPKSSARDCRNLRSFKRSKTPRDMRWSPKSVTSSSRSRSRSCLSRERLSLTCTSTPSPKRGRRILASRVTSSYWKRHASSSSESSSMSSVSEKKSRRIKCRRRASRSRYDSSKMSDLRRPIKFPLPKIFKREIDRLSRKDVPRRFIPPKLQGPSKSMSLCTETCNRVCSDMSISPLSDSCNQKDDLPENWSAFCCSDRHVTDMSISPLSDVSRFSRLSYQIGGNGYSSSKSKVEKFGEDAIQTGSSNGKFTKSNNTFGEKPLCCSNYTSNSISGTKVKQNDPLLRDLMKFHGNFKREDSLEGIKNVPPKAHVKTAASELAHKPTHRSGTNKVKQSQSKLSQKEVLLKRLQEINAAIERKKMSQLSEEWD